MSAEGAAACRGSLSGGSRLAAGRGKRHTLSRPTSGLGDAVEIGEPERTYTVEPLEDPVPRELPVGPVESPTEPPVEEPIEPERV
jgi:hypothetical protein